MCTTSPNTFLETEQEKDFAARSSSEEDSQQPDHQHYRILRTSGKVPEGFLHYLTGIVSKQGYEVVLIPKQDS